MGPKAPERARIFLSTTYWLRLRIAWIIPWPAQGFSGLSFCAARVATLPARYDDSSDASDPRLRRRFEECHHAGRRRPGFRQPAHRRPCATISPLRAFRKPIDDLFRCMTSIATNCSSSTTAIPQYVSTAHARDSPRPSGHRVQHHRAHVASVLAERGEWDKRVVGVSFDGTGYGDDGTIWGGEFFLGSIQEGFERVAHLRRALLPGGDAAAQFPVQAAAGFLAASRRSARFVLVRRFCFPSAIAMRGARRERHSLFHDDVRWADSSTLLPRFLGFTREVSFEGQAAMWLEQLARVTALPRIAYPFPFDGKELDFRPLLQSVANDRLARPRAVQDIARAFQRGIARALPPQSIRFARPTDRHRRSFRRRFSKRTSPAGSARAS